MTIMDNRVDSQLKTIKTTHDGLSLPGHTWIVSGGTRFSEIRENLKMNFKYNLKIV
jgi:hypothetical protein